jgi:hypothetical protein
MRQGKQQRMNRILYGKDGCQAYGRREAAMQLSISQQDFLVFRNPRSGDINVIYKRKDGNLG